jgi:hypothetical protein
VEHALLFRLLAPLLELGLVRLLVAVQLVLVLVVLPTLQLRLPAQGRFPLLVV